MAEEEHDHDDEDHDHDDETADADMAEEDASDSASASEMAEEESSDSASASEMAEEEVAEEAAVEEEAVEEETAAEDGPPENVLAAAVAGGSTQIGQYASFSPGLDGAINGEGPVTVFLPDDASVAGIDPAVLGVLTSDFEALDAVLAYHAVEGEFNAEAVIAAGELVTVQGESITVTVDGDTVVLNGGQATVATADLMAANGIAHVIAGLLVPPSLVEAVLGAAG